MTTRLGSFLLRVESGAEKVVSRALQRFRSKQVASRPAEGDPVEREPATARLVDAADAEPAPDSTGAAPTLAMPSAAAPSAAAPSPAMPSAAMPSRPAVSSSRPPVVDPTIYAPAGRAHLREPELPETYGRSRVVVLAIDPHHVHAYWEVTPADAQAARARLAGSGLAAPTWVLRFYDVTRVAAETANAHGHFDIEIELASRNWYVELWSADKTYLVELGACLSGEFSAVCRAKPVTVPAAEVSPPQRAEWRFADPERATTHGVAPSDPRLPRTSEGRAAEASVPDTTRSFVSGALSGVGEQPWIAAIRSLGEGAEGALAAEPPPTSKAPSTRAATPLSLEPGSQRSVHAGRDAEFGEPSRSVSLPGLASGSGGSRIQGGESNE